MQIAKRSYPGQFLVCEDLLALAIPRMEVVAEMELRGEAIALNDACLAIAVVADAINSALERGAGADRL
jgi:hypothetical protein